LRSQHWSSVPRPLSTVPRDLEGGRRSGYGRGRLTVNREGSRPMEYRLLGRSGLKVSTLSMGTVTFGNDGVWGATELAEAQRQIDLCLDRGVNLIDTANVYAGTRSESIIGEALTDGRRNRVVLATKVRFPMGQGPNDQGLSRYHIISQCEASLRRMKTDVIDLYQVHAWDGQTPLEETMSALDTLVRHGKVRYIGCSNFSAWHIMKAHAAAREINAERFVAQQIYYSLYSREAEHELVPLGIDQGLGILVWSPLAGGLMSGKYTRSSRPETGRHIIGFNEPPIPSWDRIYDIVDVINDIAGAHGCSGARVALAWLLGRAGVTSLIIGGRTTAQFEDNLHAVDLRLADDERARLDKVSRQPLPYPYWHQNMSAKARFSAADRALHDNYADGVI
jgi:aryl-alcohol dehydrogenase-like predicted oxidoreductase